MSKYMRAEDRGPIGVGGWLTLLIVVMTVIGPLLRLGTATLEIFVFEHQYPYMLSHDWWNSYKQAKWFGTIVFAGVGIWGGYSLGTIRNPIAVSRAKIALWLLYPGAVIALQIMAPAIYLPEGSDAAVRGIFPLLASLIWIAVWITYLNKSRRVKNTYFAEASGSVAPAKNLDTTIRDLAKSSHVMPGSLALAEAKREILKPSHSGSATIMREEEANLRAASIDELLLNKSAVFDENEIYAQIAREIETGSEDKGLWTKLFAESDGDERKTKVLYIKHRSSKLIADEESRISTLSMHAIEAAKLRSRKKAEERLQLEKMQRNVLETAKSVNVSPELAEAVLRHGIFKEGAKYRYNEYFYDKVADAIAYAELNSKINSRLSPNESHAASVQPHKKEASPVPNKRFASSEIAEFAKSAGVSTEDAREMLKYGIQKIEARYIYKSYRYEKLSDAIAYAKCDLGRSTKKPS